MEQPGLFEDTIYDALEALVASLGGYKRVAHALWPQKGIDAGAKDLRNALNPEHRSKLSLAALVRLLKMGQEAGLHVAISRLCTDTGYEVPQPVNTEQEVDELKKQFNRRVDQLGEIVGQLKARGVKLEAAV